MGGTKLRNDIRRKSWLVDYGTCVEKRCEDDDECDPNESEERAATELDQLSLFSAISAVPLDEDGNPLDAAPVVEPEAEGGKATDPGEAIPGLVDEEPTTARHSTVAGAVLDSAASMARNIFQAEGVRMTEENAQQRLDGVQRTYEQVAHGRGLKR